MNKESITKTGYRQKIHEIVWKLPKQGVKQCQIAKSVGYSQGPVSYILKSIRRSGIANYTVRSSPGAKSGLSTGELSQLKQMLGKEAQANGFANDGWTQKRIRRLIARQFGVTYSPQHISILTAKLGITLEVPRRQDRRQNPQERAHYRKETLP